MTEDKRQGALLYLLARALLHTLRSEDPKRTGDFNMQAQLGFPSNEEKQAYPTLVTDPETLLAYTYKNEKTSGIRNGRRHLGYSLRNGESKLLGKVNARVSALLTDTPTEAARDQAALGGLSLVTALKLAIEEAAAAMAERNPEDRLRKCAGWSRRYVPDDKVCVIEVLAKSADERHTIDEMEALIFSEDGYDRRIQHFAFALLHSLFEPTDESRRYAQSVYLILYLAEHLLPSLALHKPNHNFENLLLVNVKAYEDLRNHRAIACFSDKAIKKLITSTSIRTRWFSDGFSFLREQGRTFRTSSICQVCTHTPPSQTSPSARPVPHQHDPTEHAVAVDPALIDLVRQLHELDQAGIEEVKELVDELFAARSRGTEEEEPSHE